MECLSIRKEGSHLGHLKSSGIVDSYAAGWIVFPELGSWIKISAPPKVVVCVCNSSAREAEGGLP